MDNKEAEPLTASSFDATQLNWDGYAVDFESYYDKEVSIKTMGTDMYLRHPKMDIYLVSIYGPQGSWCGRPEDFEWGDIANFDWVSHNASFDTRVYLRLKELFPKLAWPDPEAWHCSADLCAYLGAGRDLKTASKTLLHETVDKGYRSVMLGRYFKDLSPDEQKIVTDAGIVDARNCWRMFAAFHERWPLFEQRLSLLTRQMGWKGVTTDVPALEEDRAVLKRLLWTAETQIPWAGEKDEKGKDIPILSAKQLARVCKTAGILPPKSMAKDAPEFDEWLDQYGEQFPWVRAMSEYRRINTVLLRVETMLVRTRPTDGRMGYGLKYFGGHTGRWSGDAGWNSQNQMKAPLFVTLEDTIVRDVTEQEQLSNFVHDNPGKLPSGIKRVIELRSRVIAPKGKKFVICDLSQIEPRTLAYLSRDWDFLKLVSSGMSPYEAHARVSMGWTGGKLKKEDAKKYALAKARVLALGYGAGWLKFMSMAKTYQVPDTVFDDSLSPGDLEDFEDYLKNLPTQDQYNLFIAAADLIKKRYCNAWKIVCNFRETNPRICKIWKALDLEFRRSAVKGEDYFIELPSGRNMRYCRCSSKGGWSAEIVKNGIRVREKFYGGKLTENTVQATARDVFGEAKLRLLDAGFPVPSLTVHDEVVIEVDRNDKPDEIVRLMTTAPSWMPGIPLEAEAVESDFYMK